MRIALVVERFDPLAGGLEQWTVSLARFLAARGHEVHVVTFAPGPADTGARVHLLPWRRGVFARAGLVGEALAAIGPAIVHDSGTSLGGDVFHPQTGSRLVSQERLEATHPWPLRLRARLSPVSIAHRARLASLERRQVARAGCVIAVSSLVERLLRARHGDRFACTVIHNGIDTACFDASRLAPLRGPARARLGVGEAVTFLLSAHNPRLKGVDTAIRALAPLAAEDYDVRLLVAGTAPSPPWQSLTASVGLAGRVAFLGAVADMTPLFAAADALLHPTRWDACSLSTIEAGAAGLAVITTAMNGAAELIAPGETGFVLPDPEDVPALTARLRQLLDPAVRARLGAAARIASARHGLADNLAAVEAVLVRAS